VAIDTRVGQAGVGSVAHRQPPSQRKWSFTWAKARTIASRLSASVNITSRRVAVGGALGALPGDLVGDRAQDAAAEGAAQGAREVLSEVVLGLAGELAGRAPARCRRRLTAWSPAR
jgi:hypothetical protein